MIIDFWLLIFEVGVRTRRGSSYQNPKIIIHRSNHPAQRFSFPPNTMSKFPTTITILAALGAALAPATAKPPSEAEMNFFHGEKLTPSVSVCGRQFYIPNVFGPTGMTGWINGPTLVVREVEPNSPADGIALPNDTILAVNGQLLAPDGLDDFAVLKTLGEQVEVSEQTGKMDLLIKRSGTEQTITIPIRKLGAFGRDWPYDCAKSRQVHRDACDYLASIQTVGGMFEGRIYVGFALNGLTWLASEDPQYLEAARRLAYGYRDHFDPSEISTVNWEWAYMGVFLAEYYLQTGDESIKPLAHAVGAALCRSQLPSGSWGHGPFPAPGYVQGGALNNCGLVCWMALVLLDGAGVEIDQEKLAKSTHFFDRFTHRGGVPYGDHRVGGGGNGKNALPGIVLDILGDRAGSEYFARLVTSTYDRRHSGHTGGFMGFIWGNVQGAQNPHYADYRRMLDHWKWLLNVCRRWDGGFMVPESVIGKIYTFRGPVLSTGGLVQVYAMPNRVLRMHGAPKSVFAKQELPKHLAKGVALYQEGAFEELRQLVKPDSPMARQLLGAADTFEKDLEMTMDRIEEATANGNHALARRMIADLRQRTDNARGNYRLGSLSWKLKTHPGGGKFALAQTQYERNKWLTYTDAEAREVFEALAADDSAGYYQRLARRELAKPANASDWTYLLELIFTDSQSSWQIDPKARSKMIRATTIHSGNWPMISALNILQEKGVLAELVEDWTPLVTPWTGGYPGTPNPWRYAFVRSEDSLPEDWMMPDFDDSAWETGRGPIGPNRKLGEEGMPSAPGQPYIRIEFDCERADFRMMQFGIRTKGKTIVYLNGEPILWSDATLGPRMGTKSLAMVPLSPEAISLLRKGRNVVAIKIISKSADFGMYASLEEPKLGWKPRPKDWSQSSPLSSPGTDRTPAYEPFKTVLAPCTTGLVFDPPGKPNPAVGEIYRSFIGSDDRPAANKPSIEERAKYFGHFDPRIRQAASFSLLKEGEAAMPHIIKALRSDDVRVIQSGCEAIAGNFSMNGLGRDPSKDPMTSEVAGKAVPDLLPLVKHDDMYIRAAALMALSKCGKAAAEHLDKIVVAADDEDWWVRAGVAYVLGSIAEPETGEFVDSTVENFVEERSIYGKNRFREALTQMAKRGHGTDAIVAGLIEDSKSENAFDRSSALTALSGIGPNGRAALPVLEAKLEELRHEFETTENSGRKKLLEGSIANWESIIRKTKGEAEPEKPKRPKKPKKK